MDGHLYDYYHALEVQIERQNEVIAGQNEVITQLSRTMELLAADETPAQARFRQQVMDRIRQTEETIAQTTDARIGEAEKLINQTTDARIGEADKLMNQTTDARIWEAEKLINQTTDTRIWEAEKLINQATDTKVWTTQLELEAHANKNLKALQLITACPDCTIKKAFIVGVPFHGNLGDQAQTYCIEQWLKKEYPRHRIVEVDSAVCADDDVYDLCRQLKMKSTKEDVVVLHSGYHITDLFLNEFYTFVAAADVFSTNKILCFPQSIYFEQQENIKIFQQLMNRSNFLFYAREPYSFEMATEYLPAEKCKLLPDIVTSLIGRYPVEAAERSGILFVKRNPEDIGDKENQYSKEQLQLIKSQLVGKGIEVEFSDTTPSDSPSQIKANRQKYIARIVNQYSKYRLIVTDRMHGMIFALVANTPVVVLNSKTPRLESATKLFQQDEEICKYILHCQKPELLSESIHEMLSRQFNYHISDSFAKKYFDGLRPEQF